MGATQIRNGTVTGLSCPACNMATMTRHTTPARLSEALAWLDQAELAACRSFNRIVHRTGLLRLFQVVSRLGDGVIWYTLMGVLAVGFGAAGRAAALQCALAGATGLVLYRWLKNLLVRERPYMTHAGILCRGKPLDRFSFPSGHTLHAVSFTLITVTAFPLLAAVLAPLAVLIALSRVVLGLHYPTDVLAGALLGAGVARTVMLLTGG
jgi:undecaprenyl-diphosphatase